MIADGRYDSDLANLIALEGLYSIGESFGISTFDEVPLYSRLDRIEFLSNESVECRNKILMCAAVRHLESSLTEQARKTADESNYLNMVSVTDGGTSINRRY